MKEVPTALNDGLGDAIIGGGIGSWNGSACTGITGQVATGWGGNATPLWDGAGGIITSQSDAATGNYTSIGVARASDVRPATATQTILWSGQTITGTDTLVRFTYADDYVKIDSGVAAGATGWSNGDFNYDGRINIDDYVIIDNNLPIQGPPLGNAPRLTSATAVATSPLAEYSSLTWVNDECDERRCDLLGDVATAPL